MRIQHNAKYHYYFCFIDDIDARHGAAINVVSRARAAMPYAVRLMPRRGESTPLSTFHDARLGVVVRFCSFIFLLRR